MELFIMIVVGYVIYAVFANSEEKTEKNTSIVPINRLDECEIVEDSKAIVHNTYIQNNIYVQNNYGSGKLEGHTEKVWKRKGYSLKYGETYAYKHYGNEIFTEDQVKKQRQISTRSSYTKSRSSERNTYDGWLSLGYQVRKGSRAVGGSGNYAQFDRDQVAWVG